MLEIGQRFSEIRKNLGLTQKEFSHQLGVSIGSVQGYERDQIPKGDVLKTLSDWGYDLNWFFTGLGKMKLTDETRTASLQRDVAWNVAYYLCKRTGAARDAEKFADTFMEIHDWIAENQSKSEKERAPEDMTAKIIDFAMLRLNAG
ncbi:helix-turn-helix transcriptional regulator [Terasakiella sp. A23]|uniref:helix-turn-helix domain-containing protein n=1 Tax=Terasakiella sp. FCG-A23 TaxID=3080561 RepID=UPI0029531613|nr:helix-turn-helix transcriptional regulator [Terasakiella sp. A23]MDV7340457.1 helix-turn-helix transcriptional regulator [Terasakiella sp. A23]